MKKRLAGLLMAAFLTLPTAQAQVLPKPTRDKIVQATVMLMPVGKDGKLEGTLGSGSVISPLGYILTNYHVIGDIKERVIAPTILIRTVKFVDQAPEPKYIGKVVAADPNLDLAIVQIVSTLDNKPLGALNLPFVELGDSNAATLGDPIYVFGFQGTGGDTLSFSSGSVGGFTGDNLVSSGRQWIKHDAQTGPGNSGGGIYDENGLLIGVHSAGVTDKTSARTAFARPLAVAWGLITPNVPRFVVKGGQAGPEGGPVASSPQGSAGTATTPGTAPAWPPAIALGQTYQVTIQRSAGTPKSESWTLALSGRASNGDAKGEASQGSRKQTGFMLYDQKQNLVWIDLTADGKAMTSCAFDAESLRTTPWVGRAYSFTDPNANGVRIGDCRAALGSAAAQTGQTPATSASGNLSWPFTPQIGQTWTLDVEKLGRLTLTLKDKTDKGNPRGTASPASGDTWASVMYRDEKADVLWIDMTQDGKSAYSCGFGPKSVQGRKLLGKVYFYQDENDNKGTEVGNCDAALN